MTELNHIELAWAAGFFDGEGTTCYAPFKTKKYNGYHRGIVLEVNQKVTNPYVIERFHRAISFGKIVKYNGKSEMLRYRVYTFEHVQAVIGLLWNYLSPVKREQAKIALTSYRAKKITGRGPDRGPRKGSKDYEEDDEYLGLDSWRDEKD